MHPPQVREAAEQLIRAGINDSEISRRLGIPRGTIRTWRRPTYVSRREYEIEACPRCWRPAKPMRFKTADYAELLAYYLGDGSISRHCRTWRLRVALDAKYPSIIADASALLARCFPLNPVGRVKAHGGSMIFVSVYSSHLPCLFPQHGSGPKHRRAIELESWQERMVEAAPWPFIRGCIRTDGCCFVNRTGRYEYLTYDFANMSTPIVSLFVAACRRVGVTTRGNLDQQSRIWRVRISRRASVQLLLEHVGRKE